MKQALIIMAKRPEAGKTKTRLSPPLTLPQAAELYECFLADVVAVARAVQKLRPEVQPFFAYSPVDSKTYFSNLAPDFGLVPQIGETLGDRLDHVLSSCLSEGYSQAAAINSDSPNLPPDYLAQGFAQLADRAGCKKIAADIIFGPSDDGGYYLIGVTQAWLSKPWEGIVKDVTMSTPTVLADSVAVAQAVGANVNLLPSWYDIDTVDELQRLYRECKDSQENGAQCTVRYIGEKLGDL